MTDDAGDLLCLIWFRTQGPAPADDLPSRETENTQALPNGRAHGAQYRGHGSVPVRFGGGCGGGLSL